MSTRWVAERDLAGNIVSILESNRGITELKRALEAQSRVAAIVESSDDAIVSKSLDGTITSWNRAAEQMFGYAAREAIGRKITLIVPPDRLEEEANILARLQRGERVDHFETLRRKKDGTLLEVSVTISPVKDASGRIIGASKVARDITERKRLEQFRREAEISGRLLELQEEERRRVARELHDGVGQLLAGLGMNLSRVAESAQLAPEGVRCLSEAVSLTERATSEIRTLSHLLHPPFLDEIGLKSALNEYVHGFGERSKIRVSLNLPSDLPRLPRDLELALFRIVQECLTNVHRHSGSPSASVRLSQTHGQVQLEVSDDGRGISTEIQEKFSAGKSSGVGLRGMRERVRQLGGEMNICTRGSGAAVVVALPLRGEINQEPIAQ